MKIKPLLIMKLSMLLLICMGSTNLAIAQAVTVTLNCTGTAGSFKSGNVTSTGVITDGNLAVSNVAANNSPEGWAVFDLASLNIPAGSIITAATLRITKTAAATGSGTATCATYGIAGDVSVTASGGNGTALYTALGSTGTGVQVSSTSYGNSTGNTSLTINATGRTFLQSNLTSIVSMGLTVTSTNSRAFSIYGYGGTTAQQPRLSITYLPPCSGTPATPVASGPSVACSAGPVALTATGVTEAAGITYDWQYYNGTTWVSTGGTTVDYSYTTGITTPTDFRLVTTCTTGGGAQSQSNTVSVGIAPSNMCYCSPLTGVTLQSDYWEDYINSVAIPTTTLNASGAAVGAGGYTQYNPSTAANTATLIPGLTYTLNTVVEYPGDQAQAAWIDFNQNGTFESSEYIQFTSGGVGTTATFTVPVTAVGGPTGMRVRGSDWDFITATDACTDMIYGETEDYIVTIAALNACSGTPDIPVASAPSSVCAGTTFTLTATGATVGTGITYEWQYLNGATWTPITGASTMNYTVTGGITAATDYKFVTTCATGGGANSESNVVSVALSPVTFCFCASTSTDGTYEYISNVVSGTFTNATPRSNYANYTAIGPLNTVTAGSTFDVAVTVNTAYPADEVYIFLDSDQDGVLTAAEEIGSANFAGNGSGVTGTRTITCTVPVTAAAGPTGLRIKMGDASDDMTDAPCQASFTYGEVEDYNLVVVASTNCTGTPAVATASGPANACAGVPFTLTATGMSIATGITYEWQYDNAGTWTPIAGASTASYTVSGGITVPTTYRFVTTCTTGGGAQDISNTVSVGINPPTQCYCTPVYDIGCSYEIFTGLFLYFSIDDLSLAGETTSLTNTGTGCSAGSYADYTTQTVDLAQGLTYNMDITATDFPMGTAIWIDLDDNGIFDAAEKVGNNGASGSADYDYVVPITIPATATLGNHRMRVRIAYDEDATTLDPCSMVDFGEVHDYTAIIVTPPACAPATGLTVSNITQTSADVTWTASTGAAGYDWAIDTTPGQAPGATTTINSSLTNTPPTVTTLSGSTNYYLHVRVDCGSGNLSNWVVRSFQTAISNDDAPGALTLTVGAGCSGNPYFNSAAATQSTGEPYPSCNDYTTGEHTVWYKFVAPASGAVRISTDILPAGTHEDTKVGLFSATNVNDYTTFQIISCDEDGGVDIEYNSILYATGLTAGTTYFVAVDGYNASSYGTFCLTVDEITPAMVASSGSCDEVQTPEMGNVDYTGWVPLLTDGSSSATGGKLIALVRNTAGGTGAAYGGSSITVNTGGVRQAGTGYYLDRNFHIINDDAATNVDMQLFFLGSELAALQGVNPGATLASMNVTHQSGATCEEDFAAANGANSVLLQTGNGSANGVNWIQVNTPSFSNFYLMSGSNVLLVRLGDISATNAGARNRVDWNTLAEQQGDYFVVERSIDGRNFTELGTVVAKGQASSYSYWDASPVSGTNYYRLKLGDMNGKSQYSKVVTATVKDAVRFTVEAYPNPVTDRVTVKLFGTMDHNAQLVITDVTGKLVRTMKVTAAETVVDMNGLSQGVYLIKYSDDTHAQNIKVNKQ